MRIEVAYAKLHGIRVTSIDPTASGSLYLCPHLIAAARLRPYQLVHVNSLDTGHHWETYVVPGSDQGCRPAGPAALNFDPSESLVVVAYGQVELSEQVRAPRVVKVDALNRVMSVTGGG